ncbi:uncharacterized protein LOC134249878 [Saccostrea cucullata]|uniref:uncharacterized protein LOC134249878 n=1 Tax=Saccostrea cuccullata TaxID=36930 RepID=UPI002ED223FF
MYADDMVLLSPTAEGLQEKLDILSKYCKDWCLKVNTKKTKIIVFNSSGKHVKIPFHLDNNNIECVKQYKYLGLTVNASGTLSNAKNDCCNKAKKAYFKLQKDFLTFNPSIRTALNVFDHTIKPIILYGSELWILLEAVNDFISNETRHWKARLGAYDVEKTDTLKFVMSNPLNLNISITEESNQVPQLLKYCNISDKLWPAMMPCAENFSDSLPHAASDLTWLTYVVQFTQPRNQFGNYTFSFYFEDSSNGTSSPVNIKFGIMEMPCHNSGTCQAKGIYPCNDTHRTHSFEAYYRCQCTGGYQSRYCTEDINECLSDPCEPPFVCYNNQNSYHCACPPENPNCEIVIWMVVVSVFIVVIILVLIGIAVYRYRTQRG